MKLIPYHSFRIETSLHPQALLQRVSEHTESTKAISFSKPTAQYNGVVSNSGFRIMKNIWGRNSFLPVIVGDVKPSGIGSTVLVTMRLHKVVLGFVCFWLSGVALVCSLIIALTILDFKDFSFGMLIPFVMLVFAVVLVSVGFWSQVAKQQRELTNLLSDEPKQTGAN